MQMSQGCSGCHKEIYGCCKDNTNDIQITYESVADINYTWHPQTFNGKFKQFVFSVASPRTHHIHGGCHRDITDGTDVFTDEKYDP